MELKSNEYYSILELLSTKNRKLIIPDFQRDYCWGDKTHGEKNIDIVSGFLDTLIEESENKNEDVLLGKIDVYESPKNHIYLTDGQQRLTTLYLIIGMLYRKLQEGEMKNKLKGCLISDFEEKQDDKEPYLQYAVRESTVFFLRDLVNEFFVGELALESFNHEYQVKMKNRKLDKDETLLSFCLKKQSWYFSEYNLDPSIVSILNAMGIIEKKLNTTKDLNYLNFSEFLINHIMIQYYDVKDKKHGEERFVIINTTGKSLTVSENIKPILLGKFESEDFAKQWEDRESWYWKFRDKQKENIADNGVNQFLYWCFQIIDQQDDVDVIKKSKALIKDENSQLYLEKIHSIFDALKFLIEYLNQVKFQKQLKFINDNKEIKSIVDIRSLSKIQQQNIILPLLSFISKFGNKEAECYQLLRRLRKNYFDQKWKERNNNFVDWRYVLQIIEKSESLESILQYKTTENTLTTIQNIHFNCWFNTEEKQKNLLLEYKDLLEEFEDYRDFMGDLTFLFQTSLMKNEDCEIPKLDSDFNINFEKLQTIYKNYQSTIDLIRSDKNAITNPALANMFRLFRIFIGCNKIGHIYRASWEFEGVLFSSLNRSHLLKVDFMKLLNSNNLLLHCITFVKQCINEENIFDVSNFKVEKFIKAWLSLKVFLANEQGDLLAFYDGNGTGVAAYINKDWNKLIDNEDFTLANSICGFGVCSGGGGGNYVHYTGKDLWCKPNIIDTPFTGINYEKGKRTIEQLLVNQKTIDYVIKTIVLV